MILYLFIFLMVKVTFGYSSTRSPTRSPNSPLSCDSNLRLYPCPDPQSLFLCIDNFVSSANLTPMKENLQTLANTFFNNAATYDDDFLYLSGRGVYKFGGNSKTTTSAVLDAADYKHDCDTMKTTLWDPFEIDYVNKYGTNVKQMPNRIGIRFTKQTTENPNVGFHKVHTIGFFVNRHGICSTDIDFERNIFENLQVNTPVSSCNLYVGWDMEYDGINNEDISTRETWDTILTQHNTHTEWTNTDHTYLINKNGPHVSTRITDKFNSNYAARLFYDMEQKNTECFGFQSWEHEACRDNNPTGIEPAKSRRLFWERSMNPTFSNGFGQYNDLLGFEMETKLDGYSITGQLISNGFSATTNLNMTCEDLSLVRHRNELVEFKNTLFDITSSSVDVTGQNYNLLENCPKCDVNKYINIVGKCVDCQQGWFIRNDTTNVYNCIECKTHETRTAADNECRQCPLHHSVDNHACVECPINTFKSDSTVTMCVPCPMGEVNQLNNRTCTKCPTGKYKLNENVCTDCPTGYHQDVAGQTSCKACGTGRWQDVAGQPSCKACLSGTSNNQQGRATACESCGTGKYAGEAAANECQQCEEHYYSNVPGAISCTRCADYKTNNAGRTGCITCSEKNPNFAWYGGVCRQCPQTHFKDDLVCTQCPAGKTRYYRTLTTECVNCPDNKGTDPKGTGCNRCWSDTGICPEAVQCPSGSSNSVGGVYTKSLNTSVLLTLQNLPLNFFAIDRENFAQNVSNENLNTIINTYTIKEAFDKLDFKDSFTSENVRDLILYGGRDVCYACSPGRAGLTQEDRAICNSCSSGTYQDDYGQTSCKTCPEGQFSTGTDCQFCPSGEIVSGGACSACPQHKLNRKTCYNCPQGQEFSTNGREEDRSCHLCPPGTHQSTTDNTCVNCPIGFQSAGDRKSCSECPQGTYLNSAKTCVWCPQGYTTANTGTDGIDNCVSGTGKVSYDRDCISLNNCPWGKCQIVDSYTVGVKKCVGLSEYSSSEVCKDLGEQSCKQAFPACQLLTEATWTSVNSNKRDFSTVCIDADRECSDINDIFMCNVHSSCQWLGSQCEKKECDTFNSTDCPGTCQVDNKNICQQKCSLFAHDECPEERCWIPNNGPTSGTCTQKACDRFNQTDCNGSCEWGSGMCKARTSQNKFKDVNTCANVRAEDWNTDDKCEGVEIYPGEFCTEASGNCILDKCNPNTCLETCEMLSTGSHKCDCPEGLSGPDCETVDGDSKNATHCAQTHVNYEKYCASFAESQGEDIASFIICRNLIDKYDENNCTSVIVN